MEAGAENNTQKRNEESGNSSENNNGSNSKIANSNEGQSRTKRQMKTPFQLEMLEKAYAMETYPTEETRAVLSEKLGLSDRQLQMWFCHRRLKDKKDSQQKKLRKTVVASTLRDSPIDDIKLGHEPGNEYGYGSGPGSSMFAHPELRNVVPRGVPRYYESPQTIMELRAIACVEAQLGEPFREDGPGLGIDFDLLPPDAFGASIAVTDQQKRPSLPYDNKIYEGHSVRTNKVGFLIEETGRSVLMVSPTTDGVMI
ncbi:PREDICTED: homeobox-DDT domain protein RLT1-like [Lupinus angustifolius]|uniref:homeobox-DDT domain protein RLT1-like n=1 Tax=Lupinus angustifolius TaxID=3871 RepID=UPI00092E9EB5|nr:PREDICTED: homeobox-DDT domain protein RLT1-like [Lupinus angustifolius]